jgi:hypothetical protein
MFPGPDMEIFRKLSLLVLALLVSATSALGEERRSSGTSDDLYSQGLFASLRKMESQWGRFDDTVLGTVHRTDFQNMVVERNPAITDDLPNSMGKFRVEYLSSQGLIERYEKLGKPFAFLIVRPMKVEGEFLRITFSMYWLTFEKGAPLYGLSDLSNVYFRFDCTGRKYVLDRVELRSI